MIIKFAIDFQKIDVTILFGNTNSTECCNKLVYYLINNLSYFEFYKIIKSISKTVSYSVKLVLVESSDQEEHVCAQGLRDSIFRACEFFEHYHDFISRREFMYAD